MTQPSQPSCHLRHVVGITASTRFTPSLLVTLGAIALEGFSAPIVPIAITEVMASPSPNGIDYAEITHFGTSPIPFEHLWITDVAGLGGATNLASLAAFTGMLPELLPGESLIVARAAERLSSAAAFREWWGPNFPYTARILIAPWIFGFNAIADEVQLWVLNGQELQLRHQVVLQDSEPGRSLVFNIGQSNSGRPIHPGDPGAIVATLGGDLGSPGRSDEAQPLAVPYPPLELETDAGIPIVLSLEVTGFPPPHYQWLFQNQKIPGATAPSLTLANPIPSDSGTYSVFLHNGLQSLVATAAVLRVNAEPRCASIVQGPEDIDLELGQSARFMVQARGFPIPRTQWKHNGAEIPLATNTVLFIPNVRETDEGLYSVQVENSLCSTQAHARLRIRPRPQLFVTEAMVSPFDGPGVSQHNDWFELTNFGSEPINLKGFRFDDQPGVLASAVTVTHPVWLAPGQSAIFVSDMHPTAFVQWWGAYNLPPHLPIISYPGNGFSVWGDQIWLWNAAALDEREFLIALELEPCGDASGIRPCPSGVTRWFHPLEAEFGEFSIEGERGAFRAAQSDDIGSPGWTSNEQRFETPRLLAVRSSASAVHMDWMVASGATYALLAASHLDASTWMVIGSFPATDTQMTTIDPSPPLANHRFYRLQKTHSP